MNAVVARDKTADLALLQLIKRIRVFRHEAVQLIPAHIAAVLGTCTVSGIFLRRIFEGDRAGLDLGQHLLRFLLILAGEQNLGRLLHAAEVALVRFDSAEDLLL